jgi:prepilin-type N-terminal cleavage/methylation domain-containing protein
MKTHLLRKKKGFTLIELTIAMGIGILTSSMLLGLFNQQATFLTLYNQQNFLTTEAPMVNLFVSRLVGKSDSYRFFNSLNDANNGVNGVVGPARFVSLDYRQPDGTVKTAILAFDVTVAHRGLYYYTKGAIADPQWAISKRPADVQFTMDRGIMVMTVTGPAGEVITYSGSTQS